MIVIGVDVHMDSLTAVAVDELGRALAEWGGPVEGEVVGWARALGEERLWAVEDCRHVTRGLEQTLLGEGERLVRVPPRLTAPQRRRGRSRGKSDSIDGLAVARAWVGGRVPHEHSRADRARDTRAGHRSRG